MPLLPWTDVDAICAYQARKYATRTSAAFDTDDLAARARLELIQHFPATDDGLALETTTDTSLVHRIAQCACVNELRALRGFDAGSLRESAAPLEAVTDDASTASLAVLTPQALERQLDARAALRQLDAVDAQILVAQAHGYSTPEIAAHLGISSRRVLQRASRGQEKLSAFCS